MFSLEIVSGWAIFALCFMASMVIVDRLMAGWILPRRYLRSGRVVPHQGGLIRYSDALQRTFTHALAGLGLTRIIIDILTVIARSYGMEVPR